MSGQYTTPESRCKSLHLSFNSLGHVYRAPIGNMTISPGRVHTIGGTARIEEAGLRQEHERFFRQNSPPDIQFGSSHFLKGATQVEGACL